jgi:predicted nucleotidyltransferase
VKRQEFSFIFKGAYSFMAEENLNKKEIQQKVWEFIHAFKDEVARQAGDKIDFMILYGSAARGEFAPGKSDVDIVIQVFEKSDKLLIQNLATEIFWKMARQFPELLFPESLSIADNKPSFIDKLLAKAEQKSFLYVPVFVFAKNDIDWKHGCLHTDNALVNIGKHLLIPQRSVFLRFKEEGVILYGRDVRQEIEARLTVLDRLRSGAAPLGFKLFCPSTQCISA